MRKVNKKEFIKMPAGTLYVNIGDNSNYNTENIKIKLDTGYEYNTKDYDGSIIKGYIFSGAVPLIPEIPSDKEKGYTTKYLSDYELDEHIKGSWESVDESSAEYDSDDVFLVFEENEIKFMIELLQKLCIDKDINNKEIKKIIGF